jgi:hypothetical protein
VTVKVWPATVSVPVRALDDEFAVTEKLTDPLPVPVAPVVTVIHAALLLAVQVHAPAVLTPTDPVPALAVSDTLALDNV